MRTAVVCGLGAAGRRHARVLRELRPGVNIVALRRAGGPDDPVVDEVVHSPEEALGRDPDLAIVAGPASTRAETAASFAAAGVHLLLEKPLSTSAAAARPLLDRLPDRGLRVAVGYNLRFLELLRRTREVVAQRQLGRPLALRVEVGQHLASWRPDRDHRTTVSASRELGGGALLELSHEIDYAQWLLGPVESVCAELRQLGDLDVDVEDTVELLAGFPGGVVGSLHLDMVRRPAARRFSILCESGTIEGDLLTNRLDMLEADAGAPATEEFAVTVRDTYRLQLEDVLTAIEDGRQPLVGLAAGLAALRTVDASREAARTGRRTTVGAEPDEDADR